MSGCRLIPALCYRDPQLAISWLNNAFGFQQHVVYNDAEGSVAHAELILGDAMIMLGGVKDTEYGKRIVLPEEIGGRNSQSIYVVVNDADAICARAEAAGAEIIMPLHDTDYGSREFLCRDCEGHLWSFGTYDPWKSQG